MADEADITGDRMEVELAELIEMARKPLAPGVPGECDTCGEWSGRLVRGMCAPCRDRYKID